MSFIGRSENASKQSITNVFRHGDNSIFYTTTLKKIKALLQLIDKKIWEKFEHERFVIFVVNANSSIGKSALLCGNCSKGIVKTILGLAPSYQTKSFMGSFIKNKILFMDLPEDDNFFTKNIKWLKMLYEKDDDFSEQYTGHITFNYFDSISSDGKVMVEDIFNKFELLRQKEISKIKSQNIAPKPISCCTVF